MCHYRLRHSSFFSQSKDSQLGNTGNLSFLLYHCVTADCFKHKSCVTLRRWRITTRKNLVQTSVSYSEPVAGHHKENMDNGGKNDSCATPDGRSIREKMAEGDILSRESTSMLMICCM